MGEPIKIEMLTERKALPVTPGILRGSSDRVDVDVCLTCGAIIFDLFRHIEWHEAAEATR